MGGTLFARTRLSRAAVAVALVAVTALTGGPVGNTPAASAAPADADDTIVVRWNDMLLDSIRNSTLGPPMVARALAIAHTCVYDAWTAYNPIAAGTRYGKQLRRPMAEWTEANKTEAISYAAHRAAVHLFPGRRAQLDEFMAALGYDPNHQPADHTSPAGVGVTACTAVLAFRHGDASNPDGSLSGGPPYSDWTGYRTVNRPMVVAEPFDPSTVVDPNRWQPLTYPNKQGQTVTPGYLAPHWGMVKPFGIKAGSVNRSRSGQPKYGSPEFLRQHTDLLTTSANLTDRQKAIAEYWADGPNSEQPPGHWQLLAHFVSRRDHHTVDQDAKMFFALSNAVMDAGIVAWDSKRAFESVRPITAIRMLFNGKQVRAWAGPGQGTQVIDGGTWKPYQPTWFPTPPFPEYISGHSTFSAASAEVLRLFTGSDQFGYTTTFPRGASLVEPGISPANDVVLQWATFSEAADEAGLSRRYGGIHPESGDLQGRAAGRVIGAQTWFKATLCFTGMCTDTADSLPWLSTVMQQ